MQIYTNLRLLQSVCKYFYSFLKLNLFLYLKKCSTIQVLISLLAHYNMNENLLQFIWKHQLFDKSNLKTRDNESIIIQNPGLHNKNSGPDFLEAHILINNIKWVGNIEIHCKESDWQHHNHQEDRNYDNIILHVVYEENHKVPVKCPVLSLNSLISNDIIQKHKEMTIHAAKIKCCHDIANVNPMYIRSFIDKMLIEKLESKFENILVHSCQNKENWLNVSKEIIFTYFGFKLNNDNFRLLAQSISNTAIEQNRKNLFRLEALLFGQAGLLCAEHEDEYAVLLWNEYLYLKAKYNLRPMSGHLWKFMRTRPSNFPTIRIAQLASFLHLTDQNLIEEICSKDLIWLKNKLNQIKSSPYWETHYHFDRMSNIKLNGTMGESSKQVYIDNAIVQLIFIYGKHLGDENIIEKAISILNMQKPEKNNIVADWKSLGIHAENAADSQSLIYIKNNYCDQNRCLDCNIGYQILRNKNN